jgi:DNA-binding NarL/FixJ family response regulator
MLSPAVTRTLIDRLRRETGDDRVASARAALRALTGRELDVAREVGRGHSNAEIGTRLHLSVPTVKAHVSRVFDKLQVTNRVQIAILVHDAGLE